MSSVLEGAREEDDGLDAAACHAEAVGWLCSPEAASYYAESAREDCEHQMKIRQEDFNEELQRL